MKKGDVGMAKSNKTLGRARDPHANGTWLSNWMKHEVFILGGQRIDQKRQKG